MSSILRSAGRAGGTTRFETAVEIHRPRDEVFAHAGDPRRLPGWNSAVESVEALSPGMPAAGARYVMRRRLPGGPAANELEIVAFDPPDELVLRTTSGPTPFTYRYRFAPTPRGTLVRLVGDVELPRAGGLISPIAAHLVKRGVDANLETLRGILERAPGRG